MDKQQLLRRFRNALGAALFIPLIEKEPPVEPVGQRHERMAHWADSLAEATPEGAQRVYGPFEPGCVSTRECRRMGACALVMRRVRAVDESKYIRARMLDAGTR